MTEIIGDFEDVPGSERYLSIKTLTENKIHSSKVASFLREQQPELAAEIDECCKFISCENERCQPRLYCRKHHCCLTCNSVRAFNVAEKYRKAARIFQDQHKLQLAQKTIALQPSCIEIGDQDAALLWTSKIFLQFRRLLQKKRENFNRPVSSQLRSRRELIGPILFSAHIEPIKRVRIRGRWKDVLPRIHIHMLVARHLRARQQTLLDMIDESWSKAALLYPDPATRPTIKIVQKQLICDSPEHARNSAIYAARSIKQTWTPGKTVQVADIAQSLPPRSMIGFCAAKFKVAAMPHMPPIRGDLLVFDSELEEYRPFDGPRSAVNGHVEIRPRR